MKKLIAVLLASLILLSCGPGEYDYIIESPPNFTTEQGVNVYVEEKNNPGPQTVGHWVDLTVIFWKFHFPSWYTCMNKKMQLTNAYFVDDRWIPHSHFGEVAGVALERNGRFHVIITYSENIKFQHSRYIFMHELSHVFVGECGGVWNNDGSHAIFKERGLGFYDSLLPKLN